MNVNKQNTTVPIYPKLYGHRKRYTHNYNVFFSWEKTRTENKRNETKRKDRSCFRLVSIAFLCSHVRSMFGFGSVWCPCLRFCQHMFNIITNKLGYYFNTNIISLKEKEKEKPNSQRSGSRNSTCCIWNWILVDSMSSNWIPFVFVLPVGHLSGVCYMLYAK